MADDLSLHPLCVFFPRIVGAEFDALVADIKANGLREPIVLYEGQVLDGGNRYRACLEAGREPHFIGFQGGDIAAFVLSANLHRRHLAQGQAAAIIAQITNWAEANTRGGRRATDTVPEIPLKTVADRAKASGTSERTQRTADKIAKADPELVAAVAQGEIPLSAAVAKLNEGKPKSEHQLEAEQAQEDAFADADPLAELEAAHKEIESLRADLAAIETTSPQGELLKARRLVKAAELDRDHHKELLTKERKERRWLETEINAIGRLVGEDDQKKIRAAVERMMKKAA